MPSLKIVGAVLVLVIAVSLFGGGFYLGGQHAKTKEQAVVIKTQEAQNKEVEKVQQAQVQREIVYKTKYQVIHDAKDNCLDSIAPPDILHTLRASSP